MKSRYLSLAILLVCFVIAACATTAPYNPFKVPEEEFYGKVNTIALAPVNVPRNLEDPDSVKANFESILEARLREAGYSVVPSEAFSQAWEQMIERLGGIYDPITGKVDKSKFETAQEHCRREVCTKFNADAILYPKIARVKAYFAHNQASWDGVKENMIGVTGIKKLFAGSWKGNVGALSFVASIRDINGHRMYVNRGGIQVLNKLGFGGKFVTVPREELFANEETNEAAVDIALGPLVKKSEPGDSAQ